MKIYRQNRDITQLGAQKWDTIQPDTQMYRDKGLRIRLDFNGNVSQTNDFDEDFKVSSLKCIDDTSYYHYEKSLKEALKKIGNEGETLYESKKKNEKEDAQNSLKNRFDSINKCLNFTKEEKNTEIKFLNNFYNLGEFAPDPENTEVVPFKFDKRNGFYKEFCSPGGMYDKLIEKLNKNYESDCVQTEVIFGNDSDSDEKEVL